MLKKLAEFIQCNQGDIITTGGVDGEIIKIVEEQLGLKLRNEIKEYLYQYGIIIGYGIEFLGCTTTGESSLVRETQRFRKFGLGYEYIVIRNADEWIYCFNNADGRVSSWDRNSKEHLVKKDGFEMYILNEFIDAKEEW